MNSSMFNFSGITQGSIICRTVEDMNDLILIAQKLYPQEAKDLIFAQDELKRFKATLQDVGFPPHLLESLSIFSTILNDASFFGDKNQNDFFVRSRALKIMSQSFEPFFNAKNEMKMWPLSNEQFNHPKRTPTSFSYKNCTFTHQGVPFKAPLVAALSFMSRFYNQGEARGYFKGLFPIGMHLVMCDDDHRTPEARRKDLGEMEQFLTTIQEQAKEFYKNQSPNPRLRRRGTTNL